MPKGKRKFLEFAPYRNLEYKIVNHVGNVIGIYAMLFGDKIYIGRSVNIRNRIVSHKDKEVSALNYYRYNKEHKPKSSANRKIINHLLEIEDINEVEIYVLQICETKEESMIAEKDWVKAAYHLGFHDIILNLEVFGCYPKTFFSLEFYEQFYEH